VTALVGDFPLEEIRVGVYDLVVHPGVEIENADVSTGQYTARHVLS